MRTITTQATMLLRSKIYTTSCNSLCTQAAVTLEIGKKKETLYKRLSAYRETDGNNITDTLDNWVQQGNYVKRFDIVGYVNLLRKFKKYQQANQVLFPPFCMFVIIYVLGFYVLGFLIDNCYNIFLGMSGPGVYIKK